MIKEIPILFSTPMVQAILDGRKTMTRRVVKPQPDPDCQPDIVPRSIENENDWGKWLWATSEGEDILKFCPYGKPGDLLWVRESFRVGSWFPDDGGLDFAYEADGERSGTVCFDSDTDGELFNKYWVQSCEDLDKAGIKINQETERYEDYDIKTLRLRPNIFMPKAIARIWLEVTDVRVERLQEISEEDAIGEGVNFRYSKDEDGLVVYDGEAKRQFEYLWQSINGEESWNANPWVWVISFKVLSTNGKP